MFCAQWINVIVPYNEINVTCYVSALQ